MSARNDDAAGAGADTTTTTGRAACPLTPSAGTAVHGAGISGTFFRLGGGRAFHAAKLSHGCNLPGGPEEAGAASLGASCYFFPGCDDTIYWASLGIAEVGFNQADARLATEPRDYDYVTSFRLRTASARLVANAKPAKSRYLAVDRARLRVTLDTLKQSRACSSTVCLLDNDAARP